MAKWGFVPEIIYKYIQSTVDNSKSKGLQEKIELTTSLNYQEETIKIRIIKSFYYIFENM